MINPQWLELPMFRTNFHGPEDVRAIEVRLYLDTPLLSEANHIVLLHLQQWGRGSYNTSYVFQYHISLHEAKTSQIKHFTLLVCPSNKYINTVIQNSFR